MATEGQGSDDVYEPGETVGLEEEIGEETREKQTAGEDGPDKDLFDSYEFGGQEDEQAVPEAAASANPLSQVDGKWMDGLKVCTARIKSERKFVCIDFPAVIQNKDRAVQMIGGKDCIEKTLSRNGRIELNFRPNDAFCKASVSADRKCSNLLIKVRRRKVPDGTPSSDGYEYQLEVMGVVDMVYTFDKPCDFQFLPVMKTDSGQYEEMLSKIIPSMEMDRSEYLAQPCPLFLPPITFSRRERPCIYALENDPIDSETNTFADSRRKKRVHGTHIINFGDNVVPMEPMAVARSNAERHFPSHSCTEGYEALKKVFEKRPVWSRVACQAQLNVCHERQLQYLLPLVAYYFMTGPWRNLWCKLGYDPRKHKEAKVYQVLDYRIRTPFHRHKVHRKRHVDIARLYPIQSSRPSKFETSLLQENSSTHSQETAREANKFDAKYMYRPESRPPYRQMRYQLCDIFEEQVQKKVHENDGQEQECTERDGWCVPDIADICRDILNTHVDKLLST